MTIDMCSDCGTKPAHARTLCNSCYARNRAHGTLPERVRHVGRRPCDFPDCRHPNNGGGLCKEHRRQQLAGKELRPIRHHRTGCSVLGCDGDHFAKSWCRLHYDRARKGHDLGGPHAPRVPKPKVVRTERPRATNDAPRPKLTAPKPAPGMPAGWERKADPRRAPGTDRSIRGTDVSVGVPLTRGMLAAAVTVAVDHGAGDLLGMLGIRELHDARQVWAERTGCAA